MVFKQDFFVRLRTVLPIDEVLFVQLLSQVRQLCIHLLIFFLLLKDELSELLRHLLDLPSLQILLPAHFIRVKRRGKFFLLA